MLALVAAAHATDHVDSGRPIPRSADLSDLFAWTPAPGRLALAMTARPYSARHARFDPDVTRRFVLRRARIAGIGGGVRVDVGDEVRIECTVVGDRMRCVAGARVVEATIGEEHAGSDSDPVRLFAGVRRDPFFIDVGVVHDERARDGDRIQPRGPDAITPGFVRGKVQAVVLEVDVSALFGDAEGLISVAAETDHHGVRMDRVGRPELTGFVLKQKWGAEIPGVDVRDSWNVESTFAIGPGHLGAYQDAMVAGLARLDALDGDDWQRPHPLASLLLTDALLVDPARTCTANASTFFEIEMASFQGLPADSSGVRHQTCGGRTLNADVIDEVLTLFVNGPERVPAGPPLYGPPGAHAPHRGDGIDRPRTPATDVFPYLRAP